MHLTPSTRFAFILVTAAIAISLAPGIALGAESAPLAAQQPDIATVTRQNDANTISASEATPKSISGAKLVLKQATLAYNAKAQKPKVLSIGGNALTEGTDYVLQCSPATPKNTGTYSVQAIGKGAYTGTSAKATFKITKANNPMKAKAKKSKNTLRYALVKKANQTIKKQNAFSISKAQGTVTFKKKSGPAKIVVSKKGIITVRKGLKAGTHKVKVLVKASGNKNYKPVAKTVTLKIYLRGDIKGNISYYTGEKIYHVPGDRYYKATQIDESEGERWFVTEKQARNAGWRHSKV